MRIRYSYKEYGGSSLATELSRIVGIAKSIVEMITGLVFLVFIHAIYCVANGEDLGLELNPFLVLLIIGAVIALGVGFLIFSIMVIEPAIVRLAQRELSGPAEKN